MRQETRTTLPAWSYAVARYGVHAVKKGSGRATSAVGMLQVGELPVALLELINFRAKISCKYSLLDMKVF